MQMSTRFHIIQGRKLAVSKTGASRFRNRYRAQPRQSNREFIPIVLFSALAMFCGVWSWTGQGAAVSSAAIMPVALFASDTQSASFGFCDTGGGSNCVVDGDTLYYQGTKIRIADIDTPETHPSRCAEEARLGDAATQRLHTLVNAGPFSLQSIDRDEDIYGRKLRLVTRGGRSLGQDLVDKGLARWYGGGRKSWC
jgi:micrococcal nuclease